VRNSAFGSLERNSQHAITTLSCVLDVQDEEFY
jgi:hypothetical protein